MSEPKSSELMEKIVSLCKRRGLIFQSSEIYGGLNGFWDYGPLGAELKRNIKECWWRSMTQLRDDVVGLDASIIMHPKIWEASGHTSTFSDLMVDCLLTKKRFRADQVEPQSGTAYFYTGASDEAGGKESKDAFSVLVPAGKPPESARKAAKQFYQQRGLEWLVWLHRFGMAGHSYDRPAVVGRGRQSHRSRSRRSHRPDHRQRGLPLRSLGDQRRSPAADADDARPRAGHAGR
jgi:hypothetical protein